MTIILNPCVKTILCALSTATINALASFIDAQIAVLNAQVTALEAAILQYDVLTLPVEAANALAQAALAEIKSLATLLPLEQLAVCLDLGRFNEHLTVNIDFISASLEDMTRDITRLLSVKEELSFLKAQYVAIIDQYVAIREVLAEC